jgi:hypothetical protein
MKPALCMLCAVLCASVHAQTPSASDSAPSANSQGAAAQIAPGQNAVGQNSGTQNPQQPQTSAGQNSAAQDALAAQNTAVEQRVVPLADEPHHAIVLRNDFVHVYSVSVQPLDATLIHRHDLPYLAVSLGATAVENLVVGKPEARLTLQDGQVIYSPGGFAHSVRTDSGLAFRNVTVELLKPQGTGRNICKQIVAGTLGTCPQPAEATGKKTSAEAADDDIPYFETDEVRVDVIKVAGGRDYVEEAPKLNGLLVALTNANLDVNLGGEHISFLHDGNILWLPAGTHRKVVDFLGTRSSFLLVSFKDSGAASAQ